MISIVDMEWLEKWQPLAGSALGPFLAVMFSVVGYWLKKKLDKRKAVKDTLVRISVSSCQTVDSLARLKRMLEDYVRHVRELAADIRNDTDPRMVRMDHPGLPPKFAVYHDMDLPLLSAGVRSFYLHNRLIIAKNNAEVLRSNLANLQFDLDNTVKMNNDLISLAKDSNSFTPEYQRRQYSGNLDSYAGAVEKIVELSVNPQLRQEVMVAHYADTIRGKWGKLKRWRFEGRSFKFFKNRQTIENYYRDLSALDRIDEAVKDEVDKALADIGLRSEEIRGMEYVGGSEE
jgi:hypothetical protein